MQCGGLDFSCSIASCAVNDPTEDNYAVLASDSISLYAVFDGHGGSFASRYAALHLPHTIVKQLSRLVEQRNGDKKDKIIDVNSVAECLKYCFCQCDKEILTIAMKHHACASSSGTDPPSDTKAPRFASVGSCVSLILLVDGVLFTAHCGDCRVVLCRDIAASQILANGSGRDERSNRRARLSETPHRLPPSTPSISSCSPIFISSHSITCTPEKRRSPRLSPGLPSSISQSHFLQGCAWHNDCSVKIERSSRCNATRSDTINGFIPSPPTLPIPFVLTLDGVNAKLQPYQHFKRDFHLEAVATDHFSRDRSCVVKCDCDSKRERYFRTGRLDSVSSSTKIHTTNLVNASAGVLKATTRICPTSIVSEVAKKRKTKTSDIRAYFYPSSSSTLSSTQSTSIQSTSSLGSSSSYASGFQSKSTALSSSSSSYSTSLFSLTSSIESSSRVEAIRCGCYENEPKDESDSYMLGMDYPTSSTTIEAVKDSLIVSICNENEKQSSKRKRDDLKANIDSGNVDDKKTKVNKIKNRGKVEKHASCRGVYLSDNKKSRSKHKHKVEYMSDFHCMALPLSIEVLALTTDHCLDDPVELAGLQMLSSDPLPHRPSANDYRRFGSHAINRVAGSLAVTRALGDGYLKTVALSDTSSRLHLPYVSCFPTVTARAVIGDEIAIILASDGLWNYIDAYEVAEVLKECINNKEKNDAQDRDFVSPASSPAQCLLARCQQNAANSAGLTFEALVALPVGPDKRHVLDDITIIVLFPKHIYRSDST